MTTEQHDLIEKAITKIQETRSILDFVMYRMDSLPENEYERIKEAYNLICKANDKL